MTRALVGVLAVLTAGCVGLRSAGGLHRCNAQSTALCGYVVTKLDSSGHHLGSVRLYVQFLKASNTPRGDRKGALFLLSGGPGQASTTSFDLDGAAAILQQIFPGYDLVAYDDRGTGRSGPLACPGLAVTLTAPPAETARLNGRCGRRLGTRRIFYSSRANAEDVDTVRRALGLGRIALFGVSYGTRHALAYAVAYPTHVSRLVLDSVVPVDSSESFRLRTIRAIPAALDTLCAGACRDITSDPAGDFATLANELERRPLVATVTAVKGKTHRVRIDGIRLVGMAVDTDLNPGLAAELPAAVAAALAGQPRPLERLAALEDAWVGGIQLDFAMGTATVCADSRFPWTPNTAVADRPRIFAAAAAALGPAATAPLGNWAVQIGNAAACEDWPVPSGSATVKQGPLPNVPVLILAGERDMRTPVANALTVTRQFPQSTLLVLRGAGHSVLSGSVCAARYVIAWLDDKYHGSCPRQPLALAPIGGFPSPPDGPSVAAAFATATSTLREAQAAGLVTVGLRRSLIGLSGGTLTPERLTPQLSQFQLTRYSDAAGVALTGSILFRRSPRASWSGEVDVTGTRAVTGHLTFGAGRIGGTLGGRHVSGPLGTR